MKPTYKELLQRVAELEKNNRIFDSIISQSPAAILVTDDKGAIEYVNEAYQTILGYAPKKMTDEFIYTILQGEDSVAMYNDMKKSIMADEIWRGEIKLKRKDQQVIWVRQTIFPIHKNGRITNYVSIYSDVTEQKLNEEISQEQGNLYKTLIVNLPLIISIYDINGTFIYANEVTDKFFRMNTGGVTGKNFREIFPEEVANEQYKNLQKILKTGQSTNVESRFRLHGSMHYIKSTHQPLFNEQGEITSVLVIGQNVTEQERQAELLKIQHSIDSLQSISETFEGSLKILFDKLFELDWLDGGGIYLADYETKTLKLVYHRGLTDEFIKIVFNYPFDSENARSVLDKKPRYSNVKSFMVSSTNIFAKEELTFIVVLPLVFEGRVLGSINLASKTVTDIDEIDRQALETISLKIANLVELIQTQNELDNTNKMLVAKVDELNIKQNLLIQKSRLESLGELLAGLAHEINQPLSVISLAMENINYKLGQNAASEEYLSGKFSTINQNINKIRVLIDHVRLFSRDQESIMFERVDVNKVIMNAMSMMESQLMHHRIKVITDLCKNMGYTLGNPSRLEQVILNLLSNARDALNEKENQKLPGNLTKEIRITTLCEKDRVMIIFRDDGSGISSGNLDKIFDPFFTTKTQGQGTGLGLPIVYGIIREMKGEITVRSEEGFYTEISISLPHYKNIVEKK